MDGNNSNLVSAVDASNLKGVMRAVTSGENIQFDTATGIPILSMARNYEILTYLLSVGSDPFTIYGPNTQLPGLPAFAQIASNTSKSRFIKPMLSAGADPNKGFTIRHPSSAKTYNSTLNFILESLARRNLRGESETYKNTITIMCRVTNYDEVERLKQLYPQYANMLNCQVSKASIAKKMAFVETALDQAALRTHPEQTPAGVELPHVMKNVKEYVGYRNVGPGGRRRKTKKRKYINKTKKLSNSKKRSRK